MANKTAQQKPHSDEIQALEEQYRAVYPLANSFATQVKAQIEQLLVEKSIYPTVPVQSRVKEWGSISEKIGRKSLDLKAVTDLTDLVGLRLILQFSRDIESVCQSIEENFEVLEKFNTQDRLEADQFGYASTHLIVKLNHAWLSIPTFRGMEGITAEIQARTTAQHIWASASHSLQYKHENSVPIPIRRSIHRVSALLETVDLELEIVLIERSKYIDSIDQEDVDQSLNVDLIELFVLSNITPDNRDNDREDYSDLVEELKRAGINDLGRLMDIFSKNVQSVYEAEKKLVDREKTISLLFLCRNCKTCHV